VVKSGLARGLASAAIFILASCTGNQAATGYNAADPRPQPVGRDFAGEDCHAAPEQNAAGDSGAPILVTCGEHDSLAGVVRSANLAAALPPDGTARHAAIEQAARATAMSQDEAARMICQPGRWLDIAGDAAVEIAACTLIDGAWPQVAVTFAAGRLLMQAEGAPALLPVFARVFASASGATVALGAADADSASLQKFLGTHWPDYPSSALADYERSMKDAELDDGVGNASAAEAAYRRALDTETSVFGPTAPGAGEIELSLAIEVSDQGRYEEAAELFRQAVPIVEASGDPLLRARLASYQALDAINQGRFDEAKQAARQASQTRLGAFQGGAVGALGTGVSTPPEAGELAQSLSIEAAADLRLGDYPSAEAAAAQALTIVGQTPDLPLWWRPNAIALMGQVNAAEQRYAVAEHDFQLALAERGRLFGNTLPTAITDMKLGQLYTTEGLYPAAVQSYRAAFAILDKDPAGRTQFGFDELAPFFAAATTLADKDPQQRPALESAMTHAIQLAGGGVADQTIARASALLAAREPAAASIATQLRDAELARDSARIELANETARPDDERGAIQEADLMKTIVTTDSGIDALQQKLRAVFPAYDQLADPPAADLAELRAKLRPGEAALVFAFGRDNAAGVLITSDRFMMRKLAIDLATLRSMVTRLRRGLVPVGGNLPDFDVADAYRLYTQLIAPFEPALGGIASLTVVAPGPLASLPLGVLVASPPAAGTSRDYTHTAWLIRRFAISEVPSLRALVTLRTLADAPRDAAGPAPKPFLGFGDPAFSGTASDAAHQAALADECRADGPIPAAALAALPRLPETANEVRTVAQLVGADAGSVFLGAQASETNLRSLDLGRYSIIYFATHGLLPGELHCASQPGLALSPPPQPAKTKAEDGLLDADEIAALKLNADLVVLSACNTAETSSEFGGEALFGLAEAFFYAGAHSVLASHWEIPSQATVRLMTGLFARQKAGGGLGIAEGLRQSEIALLDEPATSHPFFWGAFVLIGNGADASLSHDAGPIRSASSE
jgi:CHAT domain-containing protein